MDDFLGEVDVLRAQPERLSLSEAKARSNLDEDPIPFRHRRTYGQHAFGRPRLDPAGCGSRRTDRAGTARVACKAAILNGSLEDAGQRCPDKADRGWTEALLQPLPPVAQHLRPYAIQRLGTEMRKGVPTHTLLDTLDGGRSPLWVRHQCVSM